MQILLKARTRAGYQLNHPGERTAAKYAHRFISSNWRLPILAWLLSVITCTAMAAEVEIRVVEKTNGKPLSAAAVCLGTTADSNQFGASLTSQDGTTSFTNIPHTPLVLTVSKPGFAGYQRRQSAGSFNRVIFVKLSDGGLGPVCHTAKSAATHVATDKTGLHIKQFLVNGGKSRTQSRQVTLSSQVTGDPTHYRVSEQADMTGAIWKPYQKQAKFQLSEHRGRKTLYFQVRRFKELNGSTVQSTSKVVTARISLVSG